MTIKNLTPHRLDILTNVVWGKKDRALSYENLATVEVDSEYETPRLKVAPKQGDMVVTTDSGVEIPVSIGSVIQPEFATPLPPVCEGVKYIVSYHCLAQGVKEGRKDLLAPGRIARDAEGETIGCDGLISAVWVD